MISSLIEDLKVRLQKQTSFSQLREWLKENKSVVYDGLAGSFFALLGSSVSEDLNRLVLVITAKVGDTGRIADDFSLFTDCQIEQFPILPPTIGNEEESAVFRSDDLFFGERLRILKILADRKKEKDPGPMVLISSLAALLQPVPVPGELSQDSILLEKGKEYDRDKLVHWLLDGGYHSTSAVELPGEYSVRGDLLDIFPLDSKDSLRFEFFGDEIETLRTFDPLNQRSLNALDRYDLSRLRFHDDQKGDFQEYLTDKDIVLFHDTERIIAETENFVRLGTGPFTDHSREDQKDELPSKRTVASMVNELYKHPSIHAVPFATGLEFSEYHISESIKSVDRFCGNIQTALSEENLVYNSKPEDRFYLLCQTEAEAARLEDLLRQTVPARENRLFYLVGSLSEGFEWETESIIILGTNQLFGRLNARKTVKKKLTKIIDSFLELSPGDLVIHVGYGLARFRGLKTIQKAQGEEEHMELEFADNAVLYVPTSRIKLVQRYVGTGSAVPRLAKINGTAWNKQKKIVQAAVLDLAMEMIDIQAARNSLQGTACTPDSDWQNEFEESFPFQETDDQLTAVAAIKSDMENTRPMDRLLCGDVGFGKTELAIRAAFKAVDSGYQVAVLVPTTVLAEQHLRVFTERMAAFPITIGSLTRFVSPEERKNTILRIAEGSIDIVIGTHALTRADIHFNKLGLVIIDEEQKFGVADKEKLKKLRKLVDVLTLTATPIPRTLHFSLIGLRDISNLETPPENRLPVETKVLRFNDLQIRNAILREISRNGQVYFVHNRVFDIEEYTSHLRKIVPEARIRIGHAQMSNTELENVMRDFILHKFDVLVCTTIIESGLDIPRANTIFIDSADRFGLAELHQLRGRVGRDRYQAYCYLIVDSNKSLTPEAVKRLKAIEEYSHLGSGFQIAMRDLEIRGAGNILGTEQSGHIAAVGYEMYCDFLEAAVRMLKNEPQKVEIDIEIDLPGTAIIPQSYISEQRTKIDFYRRMHRITMLEQCDDMSAELKDRFGAIPPEVQRMLLHSRLRVLAWNYRIAGIRVSNEGSGHYIQLKFRAAEFAQKLKNDLQLRKIDLRITGDLEASIPIEKDLLNDPDHLLNFALDLFADPHERALLSFPKADFSNDPIVPKTENPSDQGTKIKKAPLLDRLKKKKRPE
ncbi:MAG: transcription-repair coupling factor [Planctomycetia bacterium]|nr:transcription-repair coupling factor [Planctomycetia bacterium]